MEALDVRGGNTYLDVGCGGGHLVQELGTVAGNKGRVVGIDPSRQMVGNARAICQNLSCVDVIEGSASEIPIGDGQFDGVAALQVYEYVEDVGSALAEARRVLKLGCPIAIVSILWEHCRFCCRKRTQRTNNRSVASTLLSPNATVGIATSIRAEWVWSFVAQ